MLSKATIRLCRGPGKKIVPRLREFFRPGQAEVVSNSKIKILATWEPFVCRALYIDNVGLTSVS